MLDEIIGVYKDISFGKGYSERCTEANGGKDIQVEIKLDSKDKTYLPKGFESQHEAYSLHVDGKGNTKIEAKHYPGVIRGLDSFSQLMTRTKENESEYMMEYLPIEIKDEPSYPYRGVMLDTSREYFFPETIKQILDSMLISRLNVFHWHLMDDDSFPLYLESYPDMTNYTAFSPEEIYTPKMIKDIVKYAKVRGIKVIPGINGPGHVNILGNYPKLSSIISCYRKPVVNGLAYGSPHGGIINPLEEDSYDFYTNMMKDIHASFECEYCHNGGIVPEFNCWNSSQEIQDFLHQGGYHQNDLTQIFFSKRKEKAQDSAGHQMTNIYWYQSNGIKYQEDDILQYWEMGGKIDREFAKYPKNKFVLSTSEMNINCGYLTPFGQNSQICFSPMSPDSYVRFPSMSQESKKQVLGVEILAWNQMSNEFDLLTKLNPHSGASSMIFWNSDYELKGGYMKERLMRLQYRLKRYGIPTSKVSMRYCEEHTHHCFGI
mmetsp:Transcript_35565/g.35205  ORF Transcript_35565/g.35205 Transcript_35565/m.35205 type:complete len:488 (-) Transcript_35565:3-1466(-)